MNERGTHSVRPRCSFCLVEKKEMAENDRVSKSNDFWVIDICRHKFTGDRQVVSLGHRTMQPAAKLPA